MLEKQFANSTMEAKTLMPRFPPCIAHQIGPCRTSTSHWTLPWKKKTSRMTRMPHVLRNKQSWMPTDGAFCHTRPAFHVISRDWQDVNEKYERRVFSKPLSIFVRLLCFWHGVHVAIKKLAAVGDFPLAVAHVSLFSTPVCSWRCIWRVETVLCLCISHWQLH